MKSIIVARLLGDHIVDRASGITTHKQKRTKNNYFEIVIIVLKYDFHISE